MKTGLSALVIFLGALLTPQLEATSILPTCVASSLLQYQTSSGCVLGGNVGGLLIFSGFTFSVQNPDGATVLNASQIEVNPEVEGLGGGFTFGGFQNAPVLAGQNVTYDINYFFLIDPGPVSSGMSLGMDPPFGSVSITQSLCADSFFVTEASGETACLTNSANGISETTPQSITVNDTDPPATLPCEGAGCGSWFAQLDLDPAVFNFAFVETEFDLTGGTTGAGFDAVGTTQDVVSATPEPLTFAMSLAGFFVLGIFRRYRG